MLENPILAGWALAVVAAAIVVVAAWLTYPRGREPALGQVAAVFALAMLSPVLLVWEVPLISLVEALPPVTGALVSSFLLAAIPEEAVKGLVVYWLVLRRRPVRNVQDGAFFGLVAGTGFALIENFLYVGGASTDADQLAFIRVVTSAPLHAAATAMVAHGLVMARLAPQAEKRGHVVRGLASAVALHGGSNACLMLAVAVDTNVLMLGKPLLLFVGLAVAANRLLDARKLDAALLARAQRGSAPLRRGTGPLRAPGTGKL